MFLEKGRGKAVKFDVADHKVLDLKSKKKNINVLANNEYLSFAPIHSIPASSILKKIFSFSPKSAQSASNLNNFFNIELVGILWGKIN
jgi:hypothetical protein